MACTAEYIQFVCTQIEGAGAVRARKMFGDWCIYVDEKPVVLACDNICYVRIHPVIANLMADACRGIPYEGAREHYILDVDHRSEAVEVIRTLLPVIPYPKKNKSN